MGLYLTYASVLVILLYTLFGLWIFIGHYIKKPTQKGDHEKAGISIVIPFRNESGNLPALINSLKKLDYPKKEIIFINDHSTDNGVEIIQKSGLTDSTIISITHEEGKKAAIAAGIAAANYDILALTDADCTVPSVWLETINNEIKGRSMVLGPIELTNKWSVLNAFQQYEFAALQSITAATCNWKMPMMSNGANIAYTKNDYLESGLRKETPSGDDIFMMESFIRRKLPVQFSWSKDSLIKTPASSTWNEMIQQKIRWASKSKLYQNKKTVNLGFFILLVNMVLLIDYTAAALFPAMSIYFGMIFLSKIMIDILIILPYLILIKKPQRLLLVPFIVLFYPIYFFLIFILSIRGKYNWKGRVYET